MKAAPLGKGAFLFAWLGGFLAGCLLFLCGCQGTGGTVRRGAVVGAGAAAGGAAGYCASGGTPLGVGLGAAGGALISHVAQGRDPSVLQEGFDRGYLQGQSDAIKRQYFLRQDAEARPPAAFREGRPVRYFLPGPTTGPEGEKLKPHYLEVRVRE